MAGLVVNMTVASLHVYPVKSCGGIQLQRAEVGRLGIRYDRQWAFVDDRGMFVAQRGDGGQGIGIRTMCLIGTAFDGDDLVLTAPDAEPLRLPLAGRDGPRVPVQVWQSRTDGIDQGDDAAAWASAVLGRERPAHYRLVRMADDGTRRPKRGESWLAYADGYPFLVIGEASLADLNTRLPEPLPMNRFRPNIVLAGSPAYHEDTVTRLRTGGITFDGMTTCVRCAITTTDQATAARGVEPLRTLATYRRADGGVIFGRNFNHRGEGPLAVGDRVQEVHGVREE
ncbi:MAG: MOSC domain-containing protein [Vicinamibacterales bacterium]